MQPCATILLHSSASSSTGELEWEKSIQSGVEIIEEIRQIEGAHEVHITAYRQEDWFPEIVE